MIRKIVIATLILTYLILAGSLSFVLSEDEDVYSPLRYGIPDTIAEHEVMAVIPPDGTFCISSETKRLVIQTSETTLDEFLKITTNYNTVVAEELAKLGITRESINIEYVGPGISRDEVLSIHSEARKAQSSITCRPLTGVDNQEFHTTGEDTQGFTIIENTDAALYTDDNAQSVKFNAPYFTGYADDQIALLNNVQTNTDYFLQAGFVFWKNTNPLWIVSPNLVWTESSYDLYPQIFSITYNPDHDYFFTITYSSGVWWICAKDTSIQTSYTCHQSLEGTGTNLKAGLGTSIFLENYSVSPAWPVYFPLDSTFHIYDAKIYRNGFAQNLASQHRHTAHQCTQSYPPANAISGSLVGGGSADFMLTATPINCP